ncbi:MAG: hypothetical protein MUC68_02925 [Burkholderiaceae bacterium]|jgi:hypothetical protein|nr:hypothetical protein [Burkholderiaceae bacterium]
MARDSQRQQPSRPIGRTARRTGGNDATWPRVPAERDESADTQRPENGAPTADDPLREDMRIAQDDLASGQKDTDERSRASDALMERLRRDE